MGKGDRKTAKGKRYNSSYGNVRSHAVGKVVVGVVAPAVKKGVVKAPVKKIVTKSVAKKASAKAG